MCCLITDGSPDGIEISSGCCSFSPDNIHEVYKRANVNAKLHLRQAFIGDVTHDRPPQIRFDMLVVMLPPVPCEWDSARVSTLFFMITQENNSKISMLTSS